MAINMLDISNVKSATDDVENSTGTYNKMMLALRAQLNSAAKSNEITDSEAGAALAQAAIALMSTAANFELSRELKDAEIAKIKRNTI